MQQELLKERFLTEKEYYETLHQAEGEISHKHRTDNNSKKRDVLIGVKEVLLCMMH